MHLIDLLYSIIEYSSMVYFMSDILNATNVPKKGYRACYRSTSIISNAISEI